MLRAGLQPKINIWQGAGGGGVNGGSDVYGPLKQLFSSLPPMLDAVSQQTNIQLPGWMPQNAPAAADGH